MNVTQILASAANAANLLSLAGVPINPAILTTINKALPVISAVQNITAHPPTSISAAVNDLATVAGSLQSTGLASADVEVQTILAEVSKYSASIKNFESGQASVVITYNVSVEGVNKKAYVVTFLEGGPAAQSLGL
jgi:hypothetical protein